jgi:hypothetical protein
MKAAHVVLVKALFAVNVRRESVFFSNAHAHFPATVASAVLASVLEISPSGAFSAGHLLS